MKDLLGQDTIFYDIGNVYEKSGNYCIAVDREKLITFKKGKFVEVKTEIPASGINEMSIGDLCEIWGVELNRFDKVVKKYFQPDDEAKSQAKKRKHQQAEDN